MTSIRLYAQLVTLLALVAVGCKSQVYTGGAPVFTSSATSSNNIESTQKSDASVIEPTPAGYITQTVYGFLDFTTTIANTVMIFSPQSAPPEGSQVSKSESLPIETKSTTDKKAIDIQPSKTYKNDIENKKDKTKIILSSIVEPNAVHHTQESVVLESDKSTIIEASTVNPTLSTVVEVKLKDDIPGVKNNLAEPEYDFLSKQPTEVVDETYKVINLRPSAKSIGQKPRSPTRREKDNPTGLVTKLGGTIVKDGLTTVHETNVIGTYINGKYAQVLQSSSRVLNPPPANNVDSNIGGKIRPSSTQRILKTASPLGKIKKQQQQQQQQLQQDLEPTTPLTQSDEPINNNSGEQQNGPRRRLRPKFRKQQSHQQNNVENVTENENGESTQPPQQQFRPQGKLRPNGSRPGYKARQQQQQQQQQSSSATTTESPSSGGTRRRNGFRPSPNSNTPTKSYKTTKSDQPAITLPNASAKLKLPRTQGRWSYKTTPKPRVTIRKQVGDDEPKIQIATEQSVVTSAPIANAVPQLGNGDETPIAQRKEGDFDGELDESESEDSVKVSVQQQVGNSQPHQTEKILPIETLNVEISTAADFHDIYYEIATMKSPYEFQVGSSRNTRYVTVTSTIKKSFATAEPTPSSVSPTEPLTENILANTNAAYESTLPLDSSIATLPPIILEPSMATPPLETITETFSSTQTLLKTHLLPVVSGNSTTRLTLVQTYNIARIVTATKTLPPSELYQFVPSKTLKEFNSKLDEAGSELHLELDFGEDERDDDDIPKRIIAPSSDLDSDLDIFRTASKKIQSTSTVLVPESATITPEQAQQLALLKLLGGSAPQLQVITTTKPVIVMETVYDTHVIPLVNAGNTFFSTLSRSVTTRPRTTYEISTATITPMPPLPPTLPQVPNLPQLPLFPPAQPQFTVTSVPVVQPTVATISDSKVLKLTFGAKTTYTTLYSTRVVPTETTTYVMSTAAALPNVPAYPGYYPPPVGYPGYPYVG